MAGLTNAGFVAKTQSEVAQTVKDQVHSNISPEMDLSSRSPWGQLIDVFSDELAQAWEAGQANYAAHDIDQAVDAALDALVKLRGTRRLPATPSVAKMTITLDAGTYTAGTLVVNVAGDPTATFSNDEDITVVTTTTLLNQVFSADSTGPLHAPANTLTVITNPVTGFSAPTNPADADVGHDRETNSQLKIRSDAEIARKGSGTVDAIKADLTATGLFDFVAVFENDTDSFVDSRPPHSIEAVIRSGLSDAAVAAQVAIAKVGGIKAYGSTVVSVDDSQGNGHAIGFTRATETPMYLYIYVDCIDGKFPGVVPTQTALVDWAADNQSVGLDLINKQYSRQVMNLPGVVDCTVKFNDVDNAGTAVDANWVIDPREIGLVEATRIVVITHFVPSPP